jgi:hypothetical protein
VSQRLLEMESDRAVSSSMLSLGPLPEKVTFWDEKESHAQQGAEMEKESRKSRKKESRKKEKWNGRTKSEERALNSLVKRGVEMHRIRLSLQYSLSSMVRKKVYSDHPNMKLSLNARIIIDSHFLGDTSPPVKSEVADRVSEKVTLIKKHKLTDLSRFKCINQALITLLLELTAQDMR